jgi:hypothetical protein
VGQVFKEGVKKRAARADIVARRSLLEPVRQYRDVLPAFQLPVARARAHQIGGARSALDLGERDSLSLLGQKVEAAYRSFPADTAALKDADGLLADLDASFRRLLQILHFVDRGPAELAPHRPLEAGAASRRSGDSPPATGRARAP